jgi:hypothetical protein
MAATPLTHLRLTADTLTAADWLAQACEDQSGNAGNRTAAIAGSVVNWAATLRAAIEANAKRFSPAEWCLIADALNGYLWPDLLEQANGMGSLGFIAAEIADAHRLNRLGDKWLAPGNKVDRAKVDKHVAELLQRVKSLSCVETRALEFVVRRFWLHPDWNLESEWWLADVADEPAN